MSETTDPTAGDRLAEELCEWPRSRAIADDVLRTDWLDAVREKAWAEGWQAGRQRVVGGQIKPNPYAATGARERKP